MAKEAERGPLLADKPAVAAMRVVPRLASEAVRPLVCSKHVRGMVPVDEAQTDEKEKHKAMTLVTKLWSSGFAHCSSGAIESLLQHRRQDITI